MSMRIHLKNVHENSPKKRTFVHEMSPKVPTRCHPFCPREVTYYVHNMSVTPQETNRKTKLANQRSLSVLSTLTYSMSSLPVKTAAGPEATHHGKLFNDPHMPLKEKREHIKWSDNWEHLKPDWLQYRLTKQPTTAQS